jgi:hypothetical protein
MRRAALILVALFAIALPAEADAFLLQFGGGIKGGMNGSVANGVDEGTAILFDDGNSYTLNQGPELYPMFGIGGAVGMHLEVRALDIVGLESGLHVSFDNGNGWEDKNVNGVRVGRVDQEQRTMSLRVPLILKASIPGFVRPTFGLGAEFVFQQSSELNYSYSSSSFDTTAQNEIYTIATSNYTLLMLTLGLEIDVDPMRIPIELRLGYNPAFSGDPNGRVEGFGTPNSGAFEIEYQGQYQAHFALMTGIIYDFDILF